MNASPNLLTPDLADVERAVSRAMWNAAKGSTLARAQIVDRMNEIASAQGRKLTGGSAKQLSEAMLEKWLNDNDPQRPSYYALAVFCKVTESLAPISALAAPLLGVIITMAQQKILEWAEAAIALKNAKKNKLRLDKELGL